MASLNLHELDPAELMPLPEFPVSFGPRNEEDQAVHAFIKDAVAGPSKKYATVSDFMRALDAQTRA